MGGYLGWAGDLLAALTGAAKGGADAYEGKEKRAHDLEMANSKSVVQQVIAQLHNEGAIDVAGIRAGAQRDVANTAADARMYASDNSAGVGYDRNATTASVAANKESGINDRFWGGTEPMDWSKIDLGYQQERGRNNRNAATNATSRANTSDRVQLGQRGQDMVDNSRKLTYALSAYKAEMARRKQQDPINFNEDTLPTFEEWVDNADDPEIFPSVRDAVKNKPDIFGQQDSTVTPAGGPNAPPKPSPTPASGRVQKGSAPTQPPPAKNGAAAAPRVITKARLLELAQEWGITPDEAQARAKARNIVVQ